MVGSGMDASPPSGLDLHFLSGHKQGRTGRVKGRRLQPDEMGLQARDHGLSLLFERGQRPDAAGIAALASEDGEFGVSADGALADDGHRNQGSGSGLAWVELLANGLTFDLWGLAPGPAAQVPDCAHTFDLTGDFHPGDLEAIWLAPGPHLAGGERMMPVIRTIVGLAAALCQLPGLVAVVWHPARSGVGPVYFSSIVGNWLEGGVFPGLGLVGLTTVADGGMQSEGVAFFTGQEIRIEPELTDDRAMAAKIAVRLIDHLVSGGPLDRAMELAGPQGRLLRIEPSANGRFVRVWSAG